MASPIGSSAVLQYQIWLSQIWYFLLCHHSLVHANKRCRWRHPPTTAISPACRCTADHRHPTFRPPCQLMPRSTCAIVLHAFCIAIFIRLNRLSRNTSKHLSLVQLMNIVSNLIFHCNHCDANTAFIKIHESTAATPSRPSGLLNAKFTF